MVYNELEGCKKDAPQLPRAAFDEIFAVDGGSTDGTVEYLESQMIRVYRQPKPGLNAAYVHANSLATGDAVVVFFPKGTVPPRDLLQFRPYFELGYDLVIGSRQVPGSMNEEDGQWLRPRKWAVRGLSLIAAALWCKEGPWVRDVLHGFKGWRRDAFESMRVLDYGLSIDIEMVVRSYKLQMRRAEFPTTEIPRSYGESHFRIWSTGKELASYLWYECRRTD